MALLLIVIAIVVVVAVLFATRAKGPAGAAVFQPNAATANHLEIVRTLYRDHRAIQVYPEHYSNVILRDGEVALFVSATAMFSEERSHTNYGGASIRVAKGVRIGGGQSHSIPTVTPIDKGELLLTNRRLIFSGAMRTMEVRSRSSTRSNSTRPRCSCGRPAVRRRCTSTSRRATRWRSARSSRPT
jgi:hypothetical protein